MVLIKDTSPEVGFDIYTKDEHVRLYVSQEEGIVLSIKDTDSGNIIKGFLKLDQVSQIKVACQWLEKYIEENTI